MKKVLLSLVTMGLALSANAQLLTYGFEETDDQSKIQPTNWENFATSAYNAAYTEDFHSGARSLYAITEGTSQTYERVVSIFNNGIQPEKSYRVSFFSKGRGSVNVCLLKGGYNHDLALQAGTTGNFKDQMFDLTLNTKGKENGYSRNTFMFWSPRREDMDAKRQTLSWLSDEAKKDMLNDSIWAQDFLRFSFNTEGEFFIDDVVIEESSIRGITYNVSGDGSVLSIDFGYAVNTTELAGDKGTKLPNECVTVTVDDEEVEISSVEVHANGGFYIFTAEPIEGDDVKVSFKNPGELKYSSDVAPFCFTEEKRAVLDFENEVAVADDGLEVETFDLDPASLIGTTPSNQSFQIEANVQEFSFSFDMPVATNDVLYGAPIATLSVGGIVENLELVTTDAFAETLVFKRTVATPLNDNTYELAISNVFNESGRPTPEKLLPVSTFEVGVINLGMQTYTEILDGTFPEAIPDNVPQGWTVVTDSEVRNYLEEGTYSGNGRVFAFTGSSAERGCYFRTSNNSDKAVGSLTSPEFELPEGRVEVRALISAWTGTAVALKVQILNAADSSVYKEETFTTTVAGANAKTGIDFQKAAIQIENCVAGKYIFRVSIASPAENGMVEACCAGYMVYTVEGEPIAQPKVLFADDFAHTEHNKVPNFETGWRCYDANGGNKIAGEGNLLQYGSGRNSSGGVMDVQGFRGMYLRLPSPANQCAIYGLGGTTTVTEGEGDEAQEKEITAPVLELPAGKHLLTYKIIGWDGAGESTTWFEIFKYEEGTDYTDADLRAPIRIEKKCSKNNLSNSSAGEAVTVSENIVIPETGRYVIKLTAQGQALFGYIQIKEVNSVGLIYLQQVLAAVTPAQEEYNLAVADPNNASQTLNDLKDIIAFGKNTAQFHTIAECEEAIRNINEAVKAMKARRANVTDYVNGSMAQLKELIENCRGTKMEGLHNFADGEATVARYDGVEVTTLSDEDLASAVSEINLGYKRFNYMVNTGVGILTQQIASLSEMLVAADEANETQEFVVAAGNAISDDQAIARTLRLLNTQALYRKIAAGYNFSNYDELIEEFLPDSLDLTAYVQNAQFYTVTPTRDHVAADAWPGWSIDNINGEEIKTGYDPGWDKSDVSEEKEVVIAHVKQGYVGQGDLKVYQTVKNLPVGKYTVTFGTLDASFRANDNTGAMDSYVFCVTDAKEDTIAFNNDNIGQYYGISTTVVQGVEVPASAGAVLGQATIGGHQKAHASFSAFGVCHLYLTGAAEGFDYAAAAEALVSGIEVVERADAPVAVSYYNLAGQEVAAPKGASLKIERYSDGYTVVKKVLVK